MSYLLRALRSLLLLPLLLTASRVFAQPSQSAVPPSREVAQYLAEVQQLIKKKSMFADYINWGKLRAEVTQQEQGLVTIEQCKPVLDHMLHALRKAGDKHSFFLSKAKATAQLSATYAGQQAESRYLGNGLGYIKVPAFSSMNASASLTFSQGIRRQLETLETQHQLTGWVVDLRHNTGGSMRPMIEGLQTLIGEEPYGYFIIPRHKRQIQLRIQREKEKQLSALPAATTQRRVAVLTDSLTGSSGEMAAIALKGLRNTKFFGQPSAGYTTTNMNYRLSDGAYLLLAEGYMVDRNRRPYLDGIVPDVVVEYSPTEALDKTLEAATKWLSEAK
jgi:carboxyl-terminal processing protease